MYLETGRLYSETCIRKLQNYNRKLVRLYSETGTVVLGNWRDLGNYEDQHQTLHGNKVKLQGIDFFAPRRLTSSVVSSEGTIY